MNRDELLQLNQNQLKTLFEAGHPIDPLELDDTEYLGISLGLPAWIDRLAWKTFIKTFHRDADTGLLRGWNLRLVQEGLDEAPRAMTRGEKTRTFGHFRVQPNADLPMRPHLTTGLLLHYGDAGNRPLDPMRSVRDPIVALNAGDASRLLGWMWWQGPGFRMPTPSYFLLERLRPLQEVVAPPSIAA
jgi:hypothetical protein